MSQWRHGDVVVDDSEGVGGFSILLHGLTPQRIALVRVVRKGNLSLNGSALGFKSPSGSI
eukprot:279103-Amphidinium_carterae.1